MKEGQHQQMEKYLSFVEVTDILWLSWFQRNQAHNSIYCLILLIFTSRIIWTNFISLFHSLSIYLSLSFTSYLILMQIYLTTIVQLSPLSSPSHNSPLFFFTQHYPILASDTTHHHHVLSSNFSLYYIHFPPISDTI